MESRKIGKSVNCETINRDMVIWEKGKLGNKKFRKRIIRTQQISETVIRKPEIVETVNQETRKFEDGKLGNRRIV